MQRSMQDSCLCIFSRGTTTLTHHELFNQVLLVQLMLQNLDESFDPEA